jgi:anti-sigma factor RsiW
METETIDKLFLELSQVTTAKTKRESELERALKRQGESHASIAMVLRGPPTDAGMRGCIKQCDEFRGEANRALGIKPERTEWDRDDPDIHGH